MEDTLALGIFPLKSQAGVTDAVLVRNYEGHRDVFVIARGSLLQFAAYVGNDIKVRFEFNLFGTVAKLVPIRHPGDAQANLLIILEDKRYAVLRSVSGKATTVQYGNLCSSTGVPLDAPFQVRQGPHGILVQFFHQVIQYFRIGPNSQLLAPFNCVVSAKSVIDFDFLGGRDGSVKLVVLVEDFKNKTKVQVYEADEQAQLFVLKPASCVELKRDAYKLQLLTDNSVIVFTTDAAYRLTFQSSGQPAQQSSSIYTSNPLCLFAKMGPNLVLAADNGMNLLQMFTATNGRVKVNRIGGINVPVALIAISGDTALAVAKDGISSIITLSGQDDELKAEIVDAPIVSESLKKIVEVKDNEFVGLCNGCRAHIVRQSLKIEKGYTIAMPGATGVWFCGDDTLIVSFGRGSRMVKFDSMKGLVACPNSSLITNEPTIGVATLGDNSFIQVTRSAVNIANVAMLQPGHILCCSISNDLISVVVGSGSTCEVELIDFSGQILRSIVISSPAEAVACNGTLVAVACWSDNSVLAFNVEDARLVRKITGVTGIAMRFTKNYLVVVNAKDACTLYSLADESEVHSLHCEGLHYSIVPIDDEKVIVTGEKPVLIDGAVLKGCDFDSFTCGTVTGNSMALLSDEKLYLCTSRGFSMSVHEEVLQNNIVDAAYIEEENKFIVVSESKGRMSLSISSHPLTSLSSSVTDLDPSYGAYVGIAAVCKDDMKLVVIVLGKNLLVYQLSDNLLHKRSELAVHAVPFCIHSFCEGIIVGYRTSFHFYAPDVVSRSDVRLKKVTEVLTQGSSSFISCDESIVAVADELQSLVLYEYDDTTCKFTEHARNCVDLGLISCCMRGDDYFCADSKGNFFRMVIGETKNVESCDLIIVGCCHIGEPVRSMCVFAGEEVRLLLATELGQYIEVIGFDPEPPLHALYQQLEWQLQSIGKFNARIYRAVKLGQFIPPSPVFYDIGVLRLFMSLDKPTQATICSKSGVDVDTACQCCEKLLDAV